jgi:hypothetical protein
MERYKRIFKETNDFLILYHGTHSKRIDKIKHEGLRPDNGSLYEPKWFMLSSTKPSAIFHANYSPDDNMFPYLVTFKIPKTTEELYSKRGWEGHPYLWKKVKVGENKKTYWYALMQPIPKEFILKIEKIGIPFFTQIKNKEISW